MEDWLMDAMEFFQRSSGKWRSQRTTHHLAFRQAEMGSSDIQVITLDAKDPKNSRNLQNARN